MWWPDKVRDLFFPNSRIEDFWRFLTIFDDFWRFLTIFNKIQCAPLLHIKLLWKYIALIWVEMMSQYLFKNSEDVLRFSMSYTRKRQYPQSYPNIFPRGWVANHMSLKWACVQKKSTIHFSFWESYTLICFAKLRKHGREKWSKFDLAHLHLFLHLSYYYFYFSTQCDVQ